MITATFEVAGMTCGHCVKAVTSEVGELDGVRHVEVDLAAGTVTVDSERPLERHDVESAIDDAGYELIS